MLFEKNMHTELTSISSLKVFPNYAWEDETPPFCIYRKSNSAFFKTLDIPQVIYYSGEYDLYLSHNSYESLQNLLLQVRAKLVSFCGRTIGGSGGTFVQDATIVSITESFDNNSKTHYAEMEAKFLFKE